MTDDIRFKNLKEEQESEKRTPSINHPSRNLEPRGRGYGIGGGYERPYRARAQQGGDHREAYGPVPHSGYYGAGGGTQRFERGRAGFNNELAWYGSQYGVTTSGEPKARR